MPPVDKHLIRDALRSVGIEGASLKLVNDAGEPVYAVTADSGHYFAKILQNWKGRELEVVLNTGIDVKLPPSHLVRGGQYVLVTKQAPGRPLSLALPFCFVPGLWCFLRSDLAASVREAGVGLGTLHAGTVLDSGPPNAEDCRIADRLDLADVVVDHLGPALTERVDATLATVRGRSLPRSKIHGDPTPHNIFWDRRSVDVSIIDFNMHPSVALEDVVVFEAGLELMAGRLPYGRASQAQYLIEPFRLGYISAGLHNTLPRIALRALKLAYYCHLLERSLGTGAPNSLQERVTRYTDRPVLERRIAALAAPIDK